jgi:RNA polymerase primary sigma factor
LSPLGGFSGREMDLNEKMRDLVHLAKAQGYLTYADVATALPDEALIVEDLDRIYTEFHNLKIEIIDSTETGGGPGRFSP